MIHWMRRMAVEVPPRLLWKFGYTLGYKNMRAVQRFNRRLKAGQHVPAFYFLSLTSACNLRCQGCWVSPHPRRDLDFDALCRLIEEAKAYGTRFFGLLGGEPLLYPRLFDLIERYPDCYFLLFTNGTLIDDTAARRMRLAGNVSPLISIEGDALVSDVRRGGKDVYARTLEGLKACRRQGLITGVASSVCKSNLDDLASTAFLETLAQNHVHYIFYYIYRPVGPMPAPELALSSDEILRFRRFMVEARRRSPVLIIDAYWDHLGRALCPAATGIMHHIGPGGDIEPCPPIQFATQTLGQGEIAQAVHKSAFFRDFRREVSQATRGCVLMDRPDLLAGLVERHGAQDTSGRGTALQELRAMAPCASHHLPGQEIPEISWPYRFAKKHWFFGFGAYG